MITKNVRYRQVHTCTPQNFAEIYLRIVDYLSFWPFLDYPTLYPKSIPITLKCGILPYYGSPESRTHGTQQWWCRSGMQASASKTLLAASVTQFFCRVDEVLL